MKEQNNCLPYRFYFFSTFFFCLAGVLVSGYLALSHYRNYTDTTYASFCAISRAINCDTVAQSPWSILGGLPVALWGIAGYLLFMILLLPLARENRDNFSLWRVLYLLGWIYSLSALFFAYISATKIHSYCILCIASYAISFSLLFQCWLVCRRFNISPFFPNLRTAFSIATSKKRIYILVAALALLFILAEVFLPHYWKLETTGIPEDISRGITEEGHPWIGAEEPVLTIEEFSDYQCFQCYKMQFTLRKLIEEHPDTIRLVHRHYPMDHEVNPIVVPSPFHVGAGKMAMLAIYATSKGKFWEMNDALFELGRSKKPFNTKYLAEKTGISATELTAALSHPDVKKVLNYDILVGMKKRITATPSFIINDSVYTGFIPPEILKEAIRP